MRNEEEEEEKIGMEWSVAKHRDCKNFFKKIIKALKNAKNIYWKQR